MSFIDYRSTHSLIQELANISEKSRENTEITVLNQSTVERK